MWTDKIVKVYVVLIECHCQTCVRTGVRAATEGVYTSLEQAYEAADNLSDSGTPAHVAMSFLYPPDED